MEPEEKVIQPESVTNAEQPVAETTSQPQAPNLDSIKKQYEEQVAAARKEAAEARALAQRLHTKPGTDSPEKAKTKLSYKEKREFEQLESDIEALENRKAEIEQEMGAGGLSHEAMHALSEDFGKVLTELEQKSDRWLELSEFA